MSYTEEEPSCGGVAGGGNMREVEEESRLKQMDEDKLDKNGPSEYAYALGQQRSKTLLGCIVGLAGDVRSFSSSMYPGKLDS